MELDSSLECIDKMTRLAALQYLPVAAVLVYFYCSASAASRVDRHDTAFLGYSERKTGLSCRDLEGACTDWAHNGECEHNLDFMKKSCPVSCNVCTPPELRVEDYIGEMLVFTTEFGEIQIQPLFDFAPRTCALIMDLAHQQECRSCKFYRNEAAPSPKQHDGPPYGLLQGSLAGMLKMPPEEGGHPPKYGYISMISGTTEFYISAMDHSSWGSAHSVWGKVLNMEVVEKIIKQSKYHEFKHPDFGTVMRMMDKPIPFTPEIVKEEEL